MKKYENYKRTESDWLPDVPSHWGYKRTKWIFKEIDERSESGQEELMSVSNYTGVTRRSEKNITMFMAEDYSGYKLCSKNDLVVNILWAWMGAMGMAPERGIVSTAYGVYRFRNPKDMHPAYFEYLVRIPQLVVEYARRSKGVTPSRARLYSDSLFKIEFPIPPVIEQRTITSFLDYKCRQIDTFIKKKKRLIALLEEQKTAIINKAVTKGLDPSVAMKPSGVEWLGEIPAHWEVRKLKYICSFQSGSNLTSEQLTEEGEFPVYGGNGIRGYYSEYTHDGNYILIGRQGALCGNINHAMSKFWPTEHAVVVYPKTLVNLFWLGELLRVMNLNQYSEAAAQPGLSMSKIRQLEILIPPIEDQDRIESCLKEEIKTLNRSVDVIASELKLIQEYKQSLIAHAVLGKIDVRDWAPPQPVSSASTL